LTKSVQTSCDPHTSSYSMGICFLPRR